MTPTDPRQAGFTLLETLVALMLLALVLVPAYSLMAGGARAGRAVERRAQGQAIAEAQLAALGVERRLAPGRYDGEGGGYRWTLTISPRTDAPFDAAGQRGMAAYRVRIAVADGRGPLVDLTVTKLVAAP